MTIFSGEPSPEMEEPLPYVRTVEDIFPPPDTGFAAWLIPRLPDGPPTNESITDAERLIRAAEEFLRQTAELVLI